MIQHHESVLRRHQYGHDVLHQNCLEYVAEEHGCLEEITFSHLAIISHGALSRKITNTSSYIGSLPRPFQMVKTP